jgi:hypothetical protein
MKQSLFKISIFTFFKLPAAWWAGVRVSKINDTSCEVSVRHRWINQNPFGSMFWAVQGMAAELSTGVFFIWSIKSSKVLVSMLVLKNKAIFKKKAKGLIRFKCDQGENAVEAINTAIETGETVIIKMKSAGTDSSGDVVSEFEFEWTLKRK